jgi:hypothetical protein
MTEGFKKLFTSYKGTAFLLCIIVVGALVGAGKVTFEQFVEFVTWAFGALVLARAGEEGMKGIGVKK